MAIHTLWQPRRRTEHNYFQALLQVSEFLESMGWNGADPYDLAARMRALVTSPFWVRYAEETARRMVTMLWVDGARDWREAARQSSRGREIYAALRQELTGPVGGVVGSQIQRNAEMIRSLPLDIAERVTGFIGQEAIKGRRAEEIAADLAQMLPDATRAKVQLIARTEVSKTSTALTRARSEEIGLDWYSWETSQDSRVRTSHEHMQGVLVRWSDPPSPEALAHIKSTLGRYHAGEAPNCRCYPAPLTDIDRVAWPHKVYWRSEIETMSRAKFARIAA